MPYRAFAKARASDQLAMSQAVFDEVSDVLYRAGLARFIDPELRDDMLDQLSSGTAWFEPNVVVSDCRDPKDNKYLELAVTAAAAFVVSSDEDLLTLNPWQGIFILRPRAYVALT